MNWLKRWVSETAYCQTAKRLDVIVDYIEINGFSDKRNIQLELEMENLKKLTCGGFERGMVLKRYQERIANITKNDQ